MRASEWQYLCAVHDPPKSCAAIDYCCHTLDGAATALTSTKMFPSRLGLGSGGVAGGGQDKFLAAQIKEITNIFRRVYRIYAHAWFQHRDMFWRVEGKTGLYIFFKTVCDTYNLIQPENYTIPPEAEGHDVETTSPARDQPLVSSILQKGGEGEKNGHVDPAGDAILSAANTAKKHSNHVRGISQSMPTTVIQEEAEEDEDSESKPKLDRTSTIYHASEKLPSDAEEPLAAAKEVEDEEEPVTGVTRSETLKPEVPKASIESEADEAADAGDETTILAEPNHEPETKPAEPDVEVKVEAVDPLELTEPEPVAVAAESKETEKSVAD